MVRLVDVIGEDGGAILARRRVGELVAKPVAVEHVVAENERDAIAADKVAAEDEGMGEADRLVLDDVTEPDAPVRAVAEQVPVKGQMLARRNQQDVADAGEHQHRQRVIDHRLVVDRQQLLVDGERRRIKPRARAAGEDDALHASRPVRQRAASKVSGKALAPGALRYAEGAARSPLQSSRVSAGRTAGVG